MTKQHKLLIKTTPKDEPFEPSVNSLCVQIDEIIMNINSLEEERKSNKIDERTQITELIKYAQKALEISNNIEGLIYSNPTTPEKYVFLLQKYAELKNKFPLLFLSKEYDEILHLVNKRFWDILNLLLSFKEEHIDDDLANTLIDLIFSEEGVIPSEYLEKVFERLSFFKNEIPDGVEPANLFKDVAERMNVFDAVISEYFASFCLERGKIKHAEAVLRYIYLYFKEDVNYEEIVKQSVIENLFQVSIQLGKNSDALRYLLELKDMYLAGEIELEEYINSLMEGTMLGEPSAFSLINFEILKDLYDKLRELERKNRELLNEVTRLSGPEESLKKEFGLFWDNFDEITKGNLKNARKAESEFKDKNFLFRDIVSGYYDAVLHEFKILVQRAIEKGYIQVESIDDKNIHKLLKLLKTKDFINFVNKETFGGMKRIKNKLQTIYELANLRNKISHQDNKLISEDEITNFMNSIRNIVEFIISIQPR